MAKISPKSVISLQEEEGHVTCACETVLLFIFFRHVTVLMVLTSGHGWLQVFHSHRLGFMKLSRLDAKDVRKELIEPARAPRPVLKRDWLRHVLFFKRVFFLAHWHISERIFYRFHTFHMLWRELEMTCKKPEVFRGAAFALATSQAVMRPAAKANR